MATASLYDTMIPLAEQLYVATKALLLAKGIKANSDVMRSIEVRAKNDLITLLSEQYLEYLSTGRKSGGKKVPIRFILEFIKQNNIKGRTQSQVSVAFAIGKSIAKKRNSEMPPLAPLLDWMQANNISGKPLTDNQLAFSIQTMIWKRGLKGKNFMGALEDMFTNMGEQKISTDVEQRMLHTLDNIKLN